MNINFIFHDKTMIVFVPIFISLIISIILSAVIITASYIIVIQQADAEKITAYECGFQPFEEARSKFDAKFYLVAILFIIFDLEVMFLFPWITTLLYIDRFGIIVMYFFLLLLTIGFFYEWKKGALDWS